MIRGMRGTALIINGTADDVHVLTRIRPAQSAAEIARVTKTNSSRRVHEKWRVKFAWQAGYGVFSVSESKIASVTRYIATQEAHHRSRSFQEEFVAFLKKNHVTYDERYIWGLSLSPLRGWGFVYCYPGLAPWAAFLCRFAAARLSCFGSRH